jgi:hypothetical protein
MTVQLKLTVDQISTAIMLLNQQEKLELKKRLSHIIGMTLTEDQEWLRLAESSLEFWKDDAEDIYNDLIPSGRMSAEA